MNLNTLATNMDPIFLTSLSMNTITARPTHHLRTSLEFPRISETERRSKETLKKLDYKVNYSEAPFLPGIGFYKTLVRNKVRLPINIPNTYFLEDSHSTFIYSRNGKLSYTWKMSKTQLIPALISRYSAVMRLPNRKNNFKVHMLNTHDLTESLYKNNLPSPIIIQKYIKTKGTRPMMIRLFHISSTKQNRPSHAYIVTNRRSEHYPIVQTQKPELLEVQPLYGKSIDKLTKISNIIHCFVENTFKIRVNEIVLDFIKGDDGKYWVIGCKGFHMDTQVMIDKYISHNKLNAVQCKFCLLMYKPAEMEHVLPYKMLLMYKRHAKKNGKLLFKLSHIREVSIDSLLQTVRLCEICYMIVLTEYKLLQKELEMAQFANVTVKIEDYTKKTKYVLPAYTPKSLKQWRVLLYIQDIQAFGGKCSKKCLLRYSLLDQTCFVKLVGNLPYAKIFYVFTENNGLKEFAQKAVCELSVKKGLKTVASGNCLPLSLFTCNTNIVNSFTQSFRVNLMSKSKIAFEVVMTVGLSYDKIVRPKNLQVDIDKRGSLYMPSPKFFTSDALPDNWLEVICENNDLHLAKSQVQSPKQLSKFIVKKVDSFLGKRRPVDKINDSTDSNKNL